MERILRILAPQDCLGCGSEGALLCVSCQASILKPQLLPYPSLRKVWTCTEYEGLSKQLLHYFKFARALSGAETLAQCLLRVWAPAENYVTIPIPTTSTRRRQRGYDQSELIAKQLAGRTGLEYASLLNRTGTARQLGSGRTIRLQQLANAFTVKSHALPLDQPLLLIDDVITTGATLEEAARALKRAGFKHIDALVFARA
jgi:ComF family protein